MIILVAGTLALTSGASATAVGAQAAVSDTLDLTLDEAYRIASRSNPVYRQAVTALRLNGPETRAVWFDQILPRIRVNPLRTSYSGRLTQQSEDFFGNPIENPESSFVYASSTGQGVSFNWKLQGANLLNFGKRQRLTNRDRRLESDAALEVLRTEVRRQYYATLGKRELLNLERALLYARRVDLDVAEQLFRLAARTRVDVLNAELDVERQNLAINRQERQYEQAVLELRKTLGDVSLPPIRLVAEGEAIFDPSEIDVTRLTDLAMDANAEMRRQRAALESAAHGAREKRAEWWPSLDVSYGYGRFAQTRGGGALFDLASDNDIESRFSIQLSVPFFDNFFRKRADIAQAVVELDRADEELLKVRLDVAEQVQSAALTLRNEFDNYRLVERSLAIAEEAFALASEEYRIGTRTFEQFRESVRSEAEARRQVIEARYAFLDGLVTLEAGAGTRVSDPSGATTGN